MATITAPRPAGAPRAAVSGAPVRLLPALLALAVAAAVGLSFPGARRAPPPRPYQVGAVSQGRLAGVLRAPARLEPTATVKVGSPVAARATSVAVAVGDRVRRGQVLARIDDAELRALAAGAEMQVVAAQASAREAEVRLALVASRLGEDALVPEDPRDQPISELQAIAAIAESRLVGAMARLERQEVEASTARGRLKQAVLRSPVDGVVIARDLEPGEALGPGTSRAAPPFVIAADPRALRVVAQVGEAEVARIRPGTARFRVPAHGERLFTAEIRLVEPAPVEPRSPLAYRVLLEARNDDGLLRPGMTATVEIAMESAADALRVPLEALRYSPTDAPRADEATVWTLEMGRAERVPVSVGVVTGRLAEVRSPVLRAGTSVLLGR